MRKPTPDSELFDWHRRALAGENPPVWDSHPMCGWYVRNYSYLGTYYPATIYMEREVCEETGELLSDEIVRCTVYRPGDDGVTAGHNVDPNEEWSYLAKRPITKAEYHILMQQILFSERYLGPSRPFVRWLDQKEIASDFARYAQQPIAWESEDVQPVTA